MQKIDLVLLWHMHQPDYRDHSSPGAPEFVLPWVYLHALKDYCDMADHLERHPQVRAVVNFVPVLAEQIEDYAAQFESGVFRDPLLRRSEERRVGKSVDAGAARSSRKTPENGPPETRS